MKNEKLIKSYANEMMKNIRMRCPQNKCRNTINKLNANKLQMK